MPTGSFDEFLNTYVPEITIWPFLINIVLTWVLAYLLGWFYVRFGRSLSNRRTLARNFVMIGMTTMLIITVVKSSLALSLGLVGALSIVRFRTAVKEPEELAYLFLTIAIGLGMGAGQRLITILACAVILAALWLRSRGRERPGQQSLFLTVSSEGDSKMRLAEVVELLEANCQDLRLRRFDESNGALEALFEVAFSDFAELERATGELRSRDDSVRVSFLQSDEG